MKHLIPDRNPRQTRLNPTPPFTVYTKPSSNPIPNHPPPISPFLSSFPTPFPSPTTPSHDIRTAQELRRYVKRHQNIWSQCDFLSSCGSRVSGCLGFWKGFEGGGDGKGWDSRVIEAFEFLLPPLPESLLYLPLSLDIASPSSLTILKISLRETVYYSSIALYTSPFNGYDSTPFLPLSAIFPTYLLVWQTLTDMSARSLGLIHE